MVRVRKPGTIPASLKITEITECLAVMAFSATLAVTDITEPYVSAASAVMEITELRNLAEGVVKIGIAGNIEEIIKIGTAVRI